MTPSRARVAVSTNQRPRPVLELDKMHVAVYIFGLSHFRIIATQTFLSRTERLKRQDLLICISFFSMFAFIITLCASCICQLLINRRVCMQILRMQLSNDELVSVNVVSVALVSDTGCQCSCRLRPSDCDNATQRYDAESCTCRCLDQSAAASCVAPRHWQPQLCLCACPVVMRCHGDEFFNHTSCAYVIQGRIQDFTLGGGRKVRESEGRKPPVGSRGKTPVGTKSFRS